MNFHAKFAVAAAVIFAVALVGYQLLPGQPGFGGQPTPASTPTLSSAQSPGASPIGQRFRIGAPFGQPIELTLPTGWVPRTQSTGQYDFGLPGIPYPYIGFFLVGSVYRDPCHPELGVHGYEPGQSSGPFFTGDSEVTGWFEELPGFEISEQRVAKVGDLWAHHLVISNSIDVEAAGCSDEMKLQLFVTRGWDDVFTVPDTRQELWVVNEVPGNLLVVGEVRPEFEANDQALIDAIVASVEIAE